MGAGVGIGVDDLVVAVVEVVVVAGIEAAVVVVVEVTAGAVSLLVTTGATQLDGTTAAVCVSFSVFGFLAELPPLGRRLRTFFLLVLPSCCLPC